MFNISTFQNNIARYGYLNEDKFDVYITPPPFMKDNMLFLKNLTNTIDYNNITNTLRFRVFKVTTPSVDIITTNVNHFGIGPKQKNPTTAGFDDIEISFLSDGYGNLYQFFYQWMRGVFEFSTETSAINGQNYPNYTKRYKDDVGTRIQIVNYDTFGNPMQTSILNSAYPVLLQKKELNWDNKNLLKIDISLTYSDWFIEGSTLTTANT